MWDLNYSSIKEIEEKLDSYGLAMSKKFGQNFLLSTPLREKIVDLLDLEDGMNVWEIGPGFGSITSLLLKKNIDVKAFEIDHGFIKILKEEAFKDEKNFSLVEGDALKTVLNEEKSPDRIIGNLPYNVGSQIIARLIENNILPDKMVFTLQKEMVDRMMSKPKEKDYSSFSVLTELDYINRKGLTLSRKVFYPEPNVDSAVVVMSKREEKLINDEERSAFLSFIREIFKQRRKTIRNNLSNYNPELLNKAFSSLNLTGLERAETLEIKELVSLFRAIKNA